MIVISCPWYHFQLVARVVGWAELPLSPIEQLSPLHLDALPSPLLTGHRGEEINRYTLESHMCGVGRTWQLNDQMVRNYNYRQGMINSELTSCSSTCVTGLRFNS